ncbi:Ig-like domain-containing protein [Mycobacterium sp. pW049]|uniref:Ig-like domain-containing protein n=1 Tax=[Mycobacterium] bulgaricum TaxID=3238985 RepID=UPI0035A85280
MGAALLGFTLVGPGPGTASADTGAESSASSDSSHATKSDRAGRSASSSDDSGDAGTAGNDAESDTDDGDESEADNAEDADDDADDDAAADLDDAQEADEDTEDTEDTGAETPAMDEPDIEASVDEVDLVGAPVETETTSTATTSDAGPEADDETAPAPWSDVVAQFLDDWTTRHIAWIDTLQVSDQRKLRMEESFYAMRRAFFNQAPTVDPVQITGVIDGPITGAVYADDADDDRIVYRIVEGPKAGALRFHADGTYTYTPGDDFTGVDTFTVVAIDAGLHVNLLNLFRPLGTRATSLINQGAVKFEFNFTNDPDRQQWTPARIAALQQAADQLIWYVRVPKAVVLTYDVVVYNDPTSLTLASASGELMAEVAGFVRTRPQHEIITGEDTNGATADGNITVNFGKNWSLGPVIGPKESDFVGVMMHELLHSWGWGNLGAAGLRRAIYSSFIVTRNREHAFNDDTTWNPAYNPNAIGQNGGLYFGGANAVEEYGGLVPVYTPATFAGGSSIHHLDDFTFVGDDYQLMNAIRPDGLKWQTLSDLEIAILKDLGYNAVALPNPPQDEEDSVDPVDVWTEDTIKRIDELNVSAQTKLSLEQSFFAMRRALFNRAPTLNPVQITGVVDGPITGNINGDDVDEDDISYRIVEGPKTGSLRLHADGTYTFTPNENFNGVDTFTVRAIDEGLHINLVNLFRPMGTDGSQLINQGAIKFTFDFKDDPDGVIWRQERLDAVKRATDELIWYFRVNKPVLLSYDVFADDNPNSPTLMSARGELITAQPGFVRSFIQHEIITGEDLNGSGADGRITVNFGHNWALTDIVGSDEVDFVGTMMHEVLHSFGWGAITDANSTRMLYASMITTKDGQKVYNSDTTFNSAYDDHLVGQYGGLYFSGANAVKEYGGLVPVFTPEKFAGGSTVHHLDDATFTGDDMKMMNAEVPDGVKIWTLSDLELAILKDLGYTVVPLPDTD